MLKLSEPAMIEIAFANFEQDHQYLAKNDYHISSDQVRKKIEQGEVIVLRMDGEAETVIQEYLGSVMQGFETPLGRQQQPSSDLVIERVVLRNDRGETTNVLISAKA